MNDSEAGIKVAERNINNLRYADNNTFMAESEGKLKSLLMKVKEESEKTDLKLNIPKKKIMASGPITSNRWGKCGKRVSGFIFFGSKINVMVTAAMKLKDFCSLEGQL